MRLFYQKIWLPLYGRWALWYMQRERSFKYAGIRLQVPAGVFHPGLFFTTTVLVDYLQHIQFQGKKVVDVGTGSGLLGLFAASKGALVTAVDINPNAVETCMKNAASNGLTVQVLRSDLFKQVPAGAVYDYVLINPPYFKANPKDDAARAFFAGENLEYFDQLFDQLPAFVHHTTRTLMILSDGCDLPYIYQKAAENGFGHRVLIEKTKWSRRMLLVELVLI